MNTEKRRCVSCGNRCNENSVREEHRKDCVLAEEMWGKEVVNDLDQFLQFFEKMGVPHDEVWGRGDHQILTVSQAHFHFTPGGEFLGVEDDEMGGFQRRQK